LATIEPEPQNGVELDLERCLGLEESEVDLFQIEGIDLTFAAIANDMRKTLTGEYLRILVR
jgi:hypothetical protein